MPLVEVRAHDDCKTLLGYIPRDVFGGWSQRFALPTRGHGMIWFDNTVLHGTCLGDDKDVVTTKERCAQRLTRLEGYLPPDYFYPWKK